MKKALVPNDILFEIEDVLGRKIRTTKSYWDKIKEIKHRELHYGLKEVKSTLIEPDEVRRSVSDSTILLYAKKIGEYDILMVATKVLNGDGFIVTVYQTEEYKKKGEIIWQTPKKK